MKMGESIKVKSFTDPKKEYMIYKTEDGYKCTCPDFVLRGHKCKHIRRLQHLKYKK
jgi:predicted nucleic acid-binding Zn finger protein